MREHSNSCTKQPLKDNKMTSIYSVYHDHRPNRASANADAQFGHQQTHQQTTTSFLNHHYHHPRCPPIVATPPSPPTTDNHLDTPVHHLNNAGTPRQQAAGQWEATTTMWHINGCLMVTAPCPAPGKHLQPIPTVQTHPSPHFLC